MSYSQNSSTSEQQQNNTLSQTQYQDDPLLAAEAAIDDSGNQIVVRPNRQFEQPEQLSPEPPTSTDSTPVLSVTAPVPEVPQTTPEQQTETPQTTPQFVKELEQVYGISAEDLKFGIDYMKQQVAVSQVEQAYRGVQQMWGVDTNEFNQRMSMVMEEFQKLPETERPKFDNVNGIYALWDRISRSQRAEQTFATGGTTVTTPQQQSKWDFTEEQINSMPPDERQRKDKLILQAYREGRVKLS